MRKDGTMFWGSVVITALHDDENRVIGFTKVTRDLTERKLADDKLRAFADQLEQKNKELEKTNSELRSFSYVASHDLQEPLRKIQAFGNLILETDKDILSKSSKDYFARMVKAANRMQNLIDSLLEFSRTSTLNKIYEQADFNVMLDEVKKELKELLEESNATVTVSGLRTLSVIPFQIKQLLSNFITNAIKYAKEGVPPVISITGSTVKAADIQHTQAQPGVDYFRLSVRDNGIGFEQVYAEKIFELFQRLHGKNEYSGSGIGLAIVKKIAENHDGFVTAEGRPGEGATFSLYLPMTR
jgi:light-regulated signal transduction histidine kinase (bacteriophytochrome)